MLKIVLILILANTGGARNEERRVYFNTLQECMEVLKVTKIITATPPNSRDDNTWIGAATCGYEEKE